MKRVFLISAMLALAASAVNAAPFGSPGLSISESGATAKSEIDGNSFFDLLTRLGLVKVGAEAKGAGAESKSKPARGSSSECPDAKKAEAEKSEPSKPGVQAGPEPVYLAF